MAFNKQPNLIVRMFYLMWKCGKYQGTFQIFTFSHFPISTFFEVKLNGV
jgi:hypothetical protein